MSSFRSFRVLIVLATASVAAIPAAGQVSEISYQLTFTRETAARERLGVEMEFTVAGAGPVLLSIPAWTPGAYELTWFARFVDRFQAEQGGAAIRWDKADFDTWRVQAGSAGRVAVRFEFQADQLDNAKTWSRPDFLMVNGTNVLPYPEGIGLDFPATVTVITEADWRVATGMGRAGDRWRYREGSYHDLVDMPLFVGAFDLDSVMVDGRPYRLASYPSGVLQGAPRAQWHREIEAMVPVMARVFGETPWNDYTTLLVFEESFGGGSALEHQNSHVGIYHPGFIGTPILASITAHEIFHAWNVKRLRPGDLVPYRYDVAQPTPWLWVSEGITDYYADLALLRAGIVDTAGFLDLLTLKLSDTESAPGVSLEDASLSTWIQPVDGSGYLYYPKGGFAGFLLDILIRDASDNRRGLDDVLGALYRETWVAGQRGFTGEDWWGMVWRMAGRDLARFGERYVDGREPFPLEEVLPLAGFQVRSEQIREPRIGVTTSYDPSGTLVTAVVAGSAAALAGVRPGDILLQVGEIAVEDEEFGERFRARYARGADGDPFVIVVDRQEGRASLDAGLQFSSRTVRTIVPDPGAGARALRIRDGLFRGMAGPG